MYITYKYVNNYYNINSLNRILITDNNYISLNVEWEIMERGSNLTGFQPSLPATIGEIYSSALMYQPGLILNKFCLKFVIENEMVGIYNRNIIYNSDMLYTTEITYDEKEDWIPVKENGPYPEDWCIVQIIEPSTGHIWLPKMGEYRTSKNKWRIDGCFEQSNGWLEGEELEKDFKVVAWRRLPNKYIPPIIIT